MCFFFLRRPGITTHNFLMGFVAICIGTAAVFEDVTRFFCFSGLRSTATLLSPGYQIQFASQHNSGSIAPDRPWWEVGVMGQEPGLGRADRKSGV